MSDIQLVNPWNFRLIDYIEDIVVFSILKVYKSDDFFYRFWSRKLNSIKKIATKIKIKFLRDDDRSFMYFLWEIVVS